MMKISLLLILIGSTFAIDCLNSFGSPVDWWVILKMPTITGVFPAGDNFYYCDSTNACSTITRSSLTVSSINAPFLRTFAQVRSQPLQIIWNDQLYNGKTLSTHAHSKGFIAGSSSGTIIVSHSMPKFPTLDVNGELIDEYPSNALAYGQHIFCASTSLAYAEVSATQFIVGEVNVFYSRNTLGSAYPNLLRLSTQKYLSNQLSDMFYQRRLKETDELENANGDVVNIYTKGGKLLKVFAYSPANPVDFYDGVITKNLQVGLVAETWGNGTPGLMDPICTSTYPSISSLGITTPDGVYYKYTKDHSKYAISLNSAKPFVCFSDINRQTSQIKRGGSAICSESASLWNTFNKIITERQVCL